MYVGAAEAVRYAEELVDVARQFGDPTSALWRRAVPTVVKYRGWGDIGRLRHRFLDLPLAEVDTTPFMIPSIRGITPSQERDHRWILAALTKHANDWADAQWFGWPVDRFGWAAGKQPKLMSERHVGEAYASSWGVLSPPYYHGGSGWCRARYVQAAAVGAVLLCGREDGRALGLP